VNDGGWISGDGGPLVVLQAGALPAWLGGSGPEPGLMLGGKVETDYDFICRCDDGGNVVDRHGRAMLVLADCEMPAGFVSSPLGELVIVQAYVGDGDLETLLAAATSSPPSHTAAFALTDGRLRLLIGADDRDGTIYGLTEAEATPGDKTCDFWWIDGSLVVALRPRT
jgi:hypothetical protein